MPNKWTFWQNITQLSSIYLHAKNTLQTQTRTLRILRKQTLRIQTKKFFAYQGNTTVTQKNELDNFFKR